MRGFIIFTYAGRILGQGATDEAVGERGGGSGGVMQWNKAVIFNEKEIIAIKNCNTNMQELGAFFSAYESRDNTIGKGTHSPTQASCCSRTTTTCTGSTHPWSTGAGATRKTARASAWRWARPSRARRCTSSSHTSSPSSRPGQSPSRSTSTTNSVPPP